jgi:ligand-binding sensor domain-containing protein
MEVLTTKNGLPDNVIFWIYEDYKGRIWFVSYNGLLSYYSNHRIVKYKYNAVIANYIGNNLYPYKTFSVDREDNVFFSSGNNGILKIDSKGKSQLSTFKKDPITFNLVNGSYQVTFQLFLANHPSPEILKAVIRKNGRFERLIENKEVYKQNMHIFLTELKVLQGVRIMRIQDSFYDLDHPKDIINFPGVTGYFPVGADLWITTVNGAYKLKNIKKHGLIKAPRCHFLEGFKVSSVYRDREKGLWFSTLDKGIVYMPNSIVKNISVFENSKVIDVTHVIVDADEDIFYSNHLGIFRLKDHFPILRSNHNARNIISRFDNILLFPKTRKELPIDLTGKKYWRVPNYYDNFNEQDTSMLLCASLVLRVHRSGKLDTLYNYYASKKYDKNLHHFFETVCSSEKGLIYAGNTKGLFCLKNGVWDNSMFPEAIRKNRVSCVRYSNELGLVIATRGEGIYVFKNGKITHHITGSNGLVSDQVNKINLEKNGKVCWVATNSGVSKLIFIGNKYVRIHNIMNVNGLATNEVNSICLHKNQVYLATKKGLSKFPSNLSFLINPLKKQVSVKKYL